MTDKPETLEDARRKFNAVMVELDGAESALAHWRARAEAAESKLSAVTKERDEARRCFDDLHGEHYDQQAQLAARDEELIGWWECALYDACMGGPVFRGWDRSALDRMRRKVENDRGRSW